MRVETTMKDLCRRCEYFDERKVENERYLCPKMNMAIWYEQKYIGCGVFKAKVEAKAEAEVEKKFQ